MKTHLKRFVCFSALVYLVFPTKAHAYVDPGTGSYMLQLGIAAIVGAVFSLKVFWAKVKTFFAGILTGGKNSKRDAKELR